MTAPDMTRLDALRIVSSAAGDDAVVTTCGLTSREYASLGDRGGTLYALNSMGLAIPIATGIAMGTGARTWVVEGDGGLLMGMSVLATLGMLTRAEPLRLVVVVLDNGAHCSTGGQPTASTVVDLGAVAEGAGLRVLRVANADELRTALDTAKQADQTIFVHARITTESAAGIPYFQPDPAVIADRFARHVARS
jgi:thiamine pyrophosphate-dependent acetolactate synthase large subunit-like protein